MKENIYRTLFWMGYVMVFIAAFISFKKDLHKITFNIESFEFHFDQVIHSVVYLIICLYFLTGQYFGLTLFKDNSINKFLFVIIILAIGTEIIQLAVPYRSFNIVDLMWNVVGIGVGFVVIWVFGKRQSR